MRTIPIENTESASESRIFDAEPGRTYGAGTRLRITPTEWSFTVPEQWQSSRPPDSELPLLISQDGRSLGMIFPLHDVTRESIHAQLEEPLSLLHGLSFVPTGAMKETETSMGRSYSGDGMIGQALAVFGPAGACVMYFIMGPDEVTTGYDAVLNALRDATRFVEPHDGADGGASPL